MNIRKRLLILVLLVLVVVLIALGVLESDPRSISNLGIQDTGGVSGKAKFRQPETVIMSKMGNETLKQALGRSSWHLIHTMAGKFPLVTSFYLASNRRGSASLP